MQSKFSWFTNDLIKKIHDINVKDDYYVLCNDEIVVDGDYYLSCKTYTFEKCAEINEDFMGIAKNFGLDFHPTVIKTRIGCCRNTQGKLVFEKYKLYGGQTACDCCIKYYYTQHLENVYDSKTKRYSQMNEGVLEYGLSEDIDTQDEFLRTNKYYIADNKITVCHEEFIEFIPQAPYNTREEKELLIKSAKDIVVEFDDVYEVTDVDIYLKENSTARKVVSLTRDDINLRLLQKNTHHNFLIHNLSCVQNIPKELSTFILQLYVLTSIY